MSRGSEKYSGRIHKRYFRSVNVVLNNDDSIKYLANTV